MRAALLALLLVACADAGDVDTNEVEVSPELDAKADAATELSVRAGDTTLWVNKTIALRFEEMSPVIYDFFERSFAQRFRNRLR